MLRRYGFWARMLDMLTSAYNRDDLRNARLEQLPETNIGRLFYLIASGFEIIFENAERVREWDDLDNAQGAVLDRYGANFGVERGAASDALYRIFIKIKMIAQLSGGDNDAIINAAAELLGVEYSDILLEDVYPAKIALYVDQTLLSEERLDLIEQIAYAIKRALLAGVGMRLYLRTYHTFRYDLLVRHGGTVQTFFSYEPIGEDRETTLKLPISHGSVASSYIPGVPVGEDRAIRGGLYVGRGAAVETEFELQPVDVARMAREVQRTAGGVYTRTHITAKRVD